MAECRDICQVIRLELSDILENEGIEKERSDAIVGDIESKIRQEFGGDSHYITMQDKTARNVQIQNDWTHGMTIPEIAKKYEIHASTAYRIVHAISSAGLGTRDWLL